MKCTSKIFLTAATLLGAIAIVTPIVTGCSNSGSDLSLVDRGDGNYYAYAGDGDLSSLNLSFDDQIANAMLNSSGYTAFKKQYANQLLYNWYKKIVDDGNVPSFKENWTNWTDSIDDDYDKQVQDNKDSHGANWKYYFQNNVLDPAGGTKQAWKYQQMISKIRDAFSNLVFNHDYLAYTTDTTHSLDAQTSTFSREDFENPSTWLNIDFYPKANTNYNPTAKGDLDDIYAQIQREAFELWTTREHPISVAMSLWKYAAPSTDEGMRSIYSSKIPNNSSTSSSGVNDSSTSLTPTYAVPGFPEYNDPSTTNANGKFYNTMELLINNNYCLDKNGFCTIDYATKYTDDSDTSIIVSANGAFGSLDEYFAGAVANLWDQSATSKTITDEFLPYDINNTITLASAGNTDILSNFMYRSSDSKIFDGTGALTGFGTSLKTLNDSGYVLDLSQKFTSLGTAGTLTLNGASTDFHSRIFNENSPLDKFDYFGKYSTYGGIQWVVNALHLTDGSGNLLPYVLIRDSFGVHLIGINGMYNFYNNTIGNGYLLQQKGDDNGQTEPLSQGRENNLLKAQYLAQENKILNSSGVNVNSALKTYFTNNIDDIVIKMAEDQAKDHNGNIIFDDSKILGNTDLGSFYALLANENAYFLIENMITDFSSATNKFYSGRITNIKNSVYSRSEAFRFDNPSNWSNCLSLTYPFAVSYNKYDIANVNYSAGITYDVTSFNNWVVRGCYGDDNSRFTTLPDWSKINDATDIWTSSYGKSNPGATIAENMADLKSSIKNSLAAINQSVGLGPHIGKDDMSKYSEHIYPAWSDSNAYFNCIYLALQDYGSDNGFSNSVKIKAMEQYATKAGLGIGANNYNLPTFSTGGNTAAQQAITSMYYTDKLFTENTPISYYLGDTSDITSASDYADLLQSAYDTTFTNKYTTENSDDLVNLWQFIDTYCYLMKNNCEELLEYLQQSIFSYGSECDIVWYAEDNKQCNSDFGDENIATAYGWKSNPNGFYDSTYIHSPDIASNTPSNYASHNDTFHYAPMRYTQDGTLSAMSLAMGYVGLVEEGSTSSVLSNNLMSALFEKTYWTKYTVSNTQNDTTYTHVGGWNKYISMDKLTNYIKDTLGSISDIKNLNTSLYNANESSDFKNQVYDFVNQSVYDSTDPEVKLGIASEGQGISPEVLKARLLGGVQTIDGKEIDYSNPPEGCQPHGLAYYVNQHASDVNNLFTKYGNGTSAMEIYDGKDDGLQHHTIDVDDAGQNVGRLCVIQLNQDDVASYDNLTAALGINASTLIAMIAAQYSSSASLQSRTINDVISTVYNGKKITVYDRRLNDKLGTQWVNDWKATN